MDLVYRALGVAASFAVATALRSINFVPLLAVRAMVVARLGQQPPPPMAPSEPVAPPPLPPA